MDFKTKRIHYNNTIPVWFSRHTGVIFTYSLLTHWLLTTRLITDSDYVKLCRAKHRCERWIILKVGGYRG